MPSMTSCSAASAPRQSGEKAESKRRDEHDNKNGRIIRFKVFSNSSRISAEMLIDCNGT